MLMMHLSRFCEELILWSSQEFQFIEMSRINTQLEAALCRKRKPGYGRTNPW